MNYWHVPVMLKEVISYLAPQLGDNVIDCTFGGGGYSFALVEKIGPQGKILSIDLDESAIINGEKNLKAGNINNIILVNDNFGNLNKIVNTVWPKEKKKDFAGIIFDLGLSSAQLEDENRGFAFKKNGPLDMSFGETLGNRPPTENIINEWNGNELDKILKNYGEEKYHKNIAQAIMAARKVSRIDSVERLVEIIRQAVPLAYQNSKKIHFATKTFQALRIATNDELANLTKALPQTIELLKTGGKLIVISYHSLEDRIVKNFLRQENRDCVCPPEAPVCRCGHTARLKILTKKPLRPTKSEIASNRRARSAKMRIALKI